MDIKVDFSDLVIKTDRLILRAFKNSDLEDFYEYAKTPGLGEMAGWPHHKSIEETKKVLENFKKNKDVLAIEKDGKVIGSLGLHPVDSEFYKEFEDKKGREIGFVLSEDYHRQKIMTEAVKAVMKYAFEDLGLDYISAGYFRGNFKSRWFQQKMGFKYYGSHVVKVATGNLEPVHQTIFTKEDYLKNEPAEIPEKNRSKATEELVLKSKKEIIKRVYFTLAMVSLIVSIIIFIISYLNTPRHFKYEKDLYRVYRGEDFYTVEFSDKVSGIDYTDTEDAVYLDAYTTKYDEIFNKERPNKSLTFHKDNLKTVLYQNHESMPNMVIGSGEIRQTLLPRLLLGFYARLSIIGFLILGLIIFILEKFKKKLISLPIKTLIIGGPLSFFLGIISIKGFNTPTYYPMSDIKYIAFLSLGIYLFLIFLSLARDQKRMWNSHPFKILIFIHHLILIQIGRHLVVLQHYQVDASSSYLLFVFQEAFSSLKYLHRSTWLLRLFLEPLRFLWL